MNHISEPESMKYGEKKVQNIIDLLRIDILPDMRDLLRRLV